MYNKQDRLASEMVGMVIIFLIVAPGWIVNLVNFVTVFDINNVGNEMMLRGLGLVLWPLGVYLGYFY